MHAYTHIYTYIFLSYLPSSELQNLLLRPGETSPQPYDLRRQNGGATSNHSDASRTIKWNISISRQYYPKYYVPSRLISCRVIRHNDTSIWHKRKYYHITNHISDSHIIKSWEGVLKRSKISYYHRYVVTKIEIAKRRQNKE